MRPRLRSLALIALPVAAWLAVVAALSTPLAAAAAPAAPDRRAITGVTWHKITLTNGWKSARTVLGMPDPAWAMSGGIVYLTGGLLQPVAGSNFFGVLPPAARPAHIQYIEVTTAGAANDYIIVGSNGSMFVAGTFPASARTLTSLAGVSYPAPATAIRKLAAINGWQSAQPTSFTGDPGYSVSGGIVHLSGGVFQPAPGSGTFAVLPPAVRPAVTEDLPVYTLNGVTGEIQVKPNGTLTALWGRHANFTSLDSASFPLPRTARHKLTLLHGWAPRLRERPAYSVAGGVVCLSGLMSQITGTSASFANLPRAIRPRHLIWINTFDTNAAGALTAIQPNGVALVFGNPQSFARSLTSLTSVCYPVNS